MFLIDGAGSWPDAKAVSFLGQRDGGSDSIVLRVNDREAVRASIHYVQALSVAARFLRRAANGNGLNQL